MLGLRKRKSLEGWAVDVDDVRPDGGDNSLRQRVADSNRLWAGSLIALVVIVASMYVAMRFAKPVEVRDRGTSAAPEARDFRNEAHRRFAARYTQGKPGEKPRDTMVIEAKFVAKDRFRIIMRGEASADEIDYAATLAAQKIEYEFHVNHPTVTVYRRRAGDGRDEEVGTARWMEEKSGYFFVLNKDEAGAQ